MGTSIPAFQTLFNYALMNLVYTSWTIYKYGFKGWLRMMLKDGWRYFILALMDVFGNYLVVLAYDYTTILSAQLINFWAIVVVVILSFLFLKVRYQWTQILGILIAIGGCGVLLASDHITGSTNYGPARNAVKGDMLMLGGATLYGLSNTFEELLVSERPLYEVVGQFGFWGCIINGVLAGVAGRNYPDSAVWDGKVAGYLIGYTGCLFIFYSLAPIMFRMSSAAFFNISILTGNFWGVVIGIKVFHYTIHYLYPIAFVMIIIGLIIYFCINSILGESRKPWLGKNQEKGVAGVGTAKRRVEQDAIV
jgi:solute carrier family 35, member F1/2